MVLETSFPLSKKCALSNSRATHSDRIPVSFHSSSNTLPVAYNMDLLNPKVGLREHFSRERPCI